MSVVTAPLVTSEWTVRPIMSKLSAALFAEDVKIYFQPKICLFDNSIMNAEALIRWNDEELGYISPLEILDAAEQMDELDLLDNWVFEKVCQHMVEWKKETCSCKSISINLCEETISKPDFEFWASNIVNKYGVPPHFIDFEILESAILSDVDTTIEKISACQAKGFTFSLDDFGTGYSSLACLRKLPINNLKINKSFIDNIEHDQQSRIMVGQIIDIGHGLGKTVIAEGVENKAQYLIVKSFGCDVVQGYYFSKPLPEKEFFDLLMNRDDKSLKL